MLQKKKNEHYELKKSLTFDRKELKFLILIFIFSINVIRFHVNSWEIECPRQVVQFNVKYIFVTIVVQASHSLLLTRKNISMLLTTNSSLSY